ncbi:MAG: hypothetical protein M0T75_07420 [Chloroflexi bacterium]|nr:hypothetical protein [Chloroflexota bacterium]
MPDEGLRFAVGDLLLTLALGVVFLVLFGFHRLDLRRRRRRAAAIREAGAFGPDRDAVRVLIAAAATLDGPTARALAAERRRAFDWDPRLEKVPKVARIARERAFANERDDVARAAADAARGAAAGALATSGTDVRTRLEAAECAAETAAALVAAPRIPAAEFRMLTRAWRTVVGPVGVAPRREG